MTKEEHDKLLTDLRQAETDVDRINIINQLQDDYSGVLAERDSLVENYNTAKHERDQYAKLNNDFWLKLNAQNNSHETNVGGQPSGNEEPPKKRSFDELNFD